MRSPFSLFIKHLKSGAVWYARFYNPSTKEYSITRSTGVKCSGKNGRKKEALRIAGELAKEICFEKSPLYIDYLESFWKENSKYAKFKSLAEQNPLSRTNNLICEK
jgi:hypothetical protein